MQFWVARNEVFVECCRESGGDIRQIMGPIIEIFRLMGLSFVTACPVRDTLDSDPRLGWDTLDSDPRLGWDKRVLTAVLFISNAGN